MKPLEIQTENTWTGDRELLTSMLADNSPPLYVEPSAEDEKRAHFMRWKALGNTEGIAAPQRPFPQMAHSSTLTTHQDIPLPVTQKDSSVAMVSGSHDNSCTSIGLSLRALTSPRSDKKIKSMLDLTGGSLASCSQHYVDEVPDFQRVLNRMVFEVDNLTKQSEVVQAKVDKLNRGDLETDASKIHQMTAKEMSDLTESVCAVQTMLSEFQLTARDVCDDIRLIKAGAEKLQTRVQETDGALRKVLSEINTLKLEQRSLSRSLDASSITKGEILAELTDLRNKSKRPTSPSKNFFRQAPRFQSTQSYPPNYRQRLRKTQTFTKLSFNLDFGTPIMEESSEGSTRNSTPESQASFKVGDPKENGLGLAQIEDLKTVVSSPDSTEDPMPNICTIAEPDNRRVRHPQFPWDRPVSPVTRTDEENILPTRMEDDKMDRLQVTNAQRALYTMSPNTFAKIARHRGVNVTKSSTAIPQRDNTNAKKDSLSCIFCKKTFKKRENTGKACQFHRGYFDTKKQTWTCCRKLGKHAKTCAVGRHFPTNR
ncbi:uncharacterized protein LOC118406940 [Branchiostoma floridae]|uniref:Uncharacterized protein LOC118406940 n=1 Tax=Branchiostoma floridae TaxID=7739 RepID=A0A9J7HP53_BRAFL|nr:uncharacterized protein LOC118406940 [Branchiostoma floridae]